MTKKMESRQGGRWHRIFSPFRKWQKDLASCFFLTFAVLILWQFIVTANAGEILVVTGKQTPVDSLNRTETANLFLGLERATPSLTPFDQRDKTLRRDFYREVAGRSLASVRAHWAKRVFTGRGRPPAMLAGEEVQQTIKQDSGAVTYVPDEQLPKDGKVLLYLPRDGKP